MTMQSFNSFIGNPSIEKIITFEEVQRELMSLVSTSVKKKSCGSINGLTFKEQKSKLFREKLTTDTKCSINKRPIISRDYIEYTFSLISGIIDDINNLKRNLIIIDNKENQFRIEINALNIPHLLGFIPCSEASKNKNGISFYKKVCGTKKISDEDYLINIKSLFESKDEIDNLLEDIYSNESENRLNADKLFAKIICLRTFLNIIKKSLINEDETCIQLYKKKLLKGEIDDRILIVFKDETTGFKVGIEFNKTNNQLISIRFVSDRMDSYTPIGCNGMVKAKIINIDNIETMNNGYGLIPPNDKKNTQLFNTLSESSQELSKERLRKDLFSLDKDNLLKYASNILSNNNVDDDFKYFVYLYLSSIVIKDNIQNNPRIDYLNNIYFSANKIKKDLCVEEIKDMCLIGLNRTQWLLSLKPEELSLTLSSSLLVSPFNYVYDNRNGDINIDSVLKDLKELYNRIININVQNVDSAYEYFKLLYSYYITIENIYSYYSLNLGENESYYDSKERKLILYFTEQDKQ